ncbi:MAG TPA: isoprenylcysteine carboxylmethyltransferase family protein, partial [bacterium]|nr:isoprenylcysteine carboxylmethyltransferase family protein [bacterium]
MGTDGTGFLRRLARRRATAGWVFILLVAAFARTPGILFWPGVFLTLLGEVLRTSSAGVIKKNQEVARTGPYRWCRHPLYFGSFLVTLGLSSASGNWVLLLLGLLLFPVFYIPAIIVEEKFLTKKFGQEYEAYKKVTPVFLPGPAPTSWKDFS